MDVINRNNYESYFLLYADNELSPAERKLVEDFVLLHPDLAAEFEALQDTRLHPDNIIFPAKSLLYKTTETSVNITPENCEEFFILYYDNELNETERKAVETFVAGNSSFKESFELFGRLNMNTGEAVEFPGMAALYRLPSGDSYATMLDYLDNELPAAEAKNFERQLQQDAAMNREFSILAQTKLSADTSVRFPNIQSLYKTEEKRRTPVVPLWMRLAAAAAVLLFVAWMAFWRNGGATKPEENIASVKEPVSLPAQKNNNGTQQANNNAGNNNIAAANNEEKAQPVNTTLNGNTNNNNHVTSVLPERNNNKQVVQNVPGPEQPVLAQDKTPGQLPEELKQIFDRQRTNETIASVQPEVKNIKPENIYGGSKEEKITYAAHITEDKVPEKETTVMGVIPADNIARKTGLKSLGRKVSRFFERKIKNGNPLSIGGVEIALAR